MKNILNLIVIASFFTSCEKVIDIDYKNNQPAIIIEGNITNDAGPSIYGSFCAFPFI